MYFEFLNDIYLNVYFVVKFLGCWDCELENCLIIIDFLKVMNRIFCVYEIFD